MQSSTGVPAIVLPVMQEANAVFSPFVSRPMFALVLFAPIRSFRVFGFAVR